MGVCFLLSLLVPSLRISFVLSQSGTQACFFISAISYVACMLYLVAVFYDMLNWFSHFPEAIQSASSASVSFLLIRNFFCILVY